MNNPNYQKAFFLLSVADLSQLPPDEGREVAIIGRSNAGKSSVLNQLTQNKKLARVSKTPGRTQLINLFGLDDTCRLADLPGYGYAKVPPAMKRKWQILLDNYLRSRECLQGLILVMDIRHPLKEFDQKMLEWSQQCDLPVHILLNKCDKLTQSAASKTVREVKTALKNFTNEIHVQAFSASKGKGVKELRACLDGWFTS
ncbi:MAG TPA: ribosome biogenesis GTP-binding protein YihA/YsxC [Gammaproteobacteria bacterium]|nr:ribosome biogenesis GTP-binding protein YihA/YsxC [Gammaproteobacteria bacterium]